MQDERMYGFRLRCGVKAIVVRLDSVLDCGLVFIKQIRVKTRLG